MILRVRQLAVAGLCAAALLPARPAFAQSEAQKLGAAQALFERAEALMTERKYDEACPKLAEVVRLVPEGLGAKMKLAACYEEAGHLASAWGSYMLAEAAASRAGQADRAKHARTRAAALKPKLSSLKITVPEGLRGLPGLEVKRDGEPVSAEQWGLGVPADAGSHAVVVTATGRKPWQISVEVKGGAVEATVSAPAELEAEPAPAPAQPVKPVEAPARGGIPVWAWILGAGGIGCAGVAIAFAVDIPAAQTDAEFGINGADRTPRDYGMAIAFGVAGAAALGVSIYGIASGSSKPKAQSRFVLPVPWVGHGTKGLVWQGTF